MSNTNYCQFFFKEKSFTTLNNITINIISINPVTTEECRGLLRGKSGIYVWINTVNNKIYIGSSTCLWRRFKYYINAFRKKDGHNMHLTNSVYKYGIDSIKFGIIEILNNDRTVLKIKEQDLLDNICPFDEIGFNVSKSAFRPLNCEISKEGRQRIRERHTGENSEMSKLKNSDVLTIKWRIAEGATLKSLSLQFGVSITVISNIKRGLTWNHIKVNKKTQDKLTNSNLKEKHKHSIETVQMIKKDIADGQRMIDISKKYGIPYMTINSIKRGVIHSSVAIS